MDKEQARFILRSFRPDGADAGDPDFAEALKLAMENRELGEWLASERAFDAEFASALGTVDLPENLREDIMACLAAERGDFPQAEDAEDAALIGAMASIQPPASLRDAVLAAMARTVELDVVPPKISIVRRLAIPLAAAAGIALAFFFTRHSNTPATTAAGPLVAGNVHAVSLEAVRDGFVRTIESPSFDLEEKQEDRQLLDQHLRSRKLPCPGKLPAGLANVKGLGCRELVIDGKHGSLVCFKVAGNGVVHLVIFRRADVSCKLPPKDKPAFEQDGKWASARWVDGDKAFLLISQTGVDRLTALF
jgi:hypothetical protein